MACTDGVGKWLALEHAACGRRYGAGRVVGTDSPSCALVDLCDGGHVATLLVLYQNFLC